MISRNHYHYTTLCGEDTGTYGMEWDFSDFGGNKNGGGEKGDKK